MYGNKCHPYITSEQDLELTCLSKSVFVNT